MKRVLQKKKTGGCCRRMYEISDLGNLSWKKTRVHLLHCEVRSRMEEESAKNRV